MSPALIVLRIAVIIFTVDGLVVLVHSALPPVFQAMAARSEWGLAAVDAIALVLISSPFVYLWVIRPYVLARSHGESVLRESERRLHEAQRTAHIGSWELDLRASALSWSDEIYRIFEIDPAYFGASYEAFLAAIHPEDREMVNKAYTVSLSNRSPYEISHRLRMLDGRIKWVREHCETDFSADGKPLISRGTVQDITDLWRVENALRESHTKISGILEMSEEAIILADNDLRVSLFSRGAQRVFGYEAEEAIGLKIEKLIPEWLRALHQNHVRNFTEGLETNLRMGARRELTALSKTGAEFSAAISISKFPSDSGYFYSMIVRDIGPEKAAHANLLAAKLAADSANQAKSCFLANMSHELRTPLNAIIGFSEIIGRQTYGPVGSGKYIEYANDINKSGMHLLNIINDILDLSKVEVGEAKLYEEAIDVSESIQSCLRLVAARAETGGVGLRLHLESDLPLFYADETRLKQILINLLSNAIKFTPAHGEVKIKVWSRRESGYVFQIMDTGIGIAFEDIPASLTPFRQVDSDLNRKFDGTGLGLPLAKLLAEMHGGSLDLQSCVGVGTTVTVRFPAERIVSKAATGTLSPSASNPQVKKVKAQT